MNIRQLMFVTVFFSLNALSAAEQMPEASSSDTHRENESLLDYGICTLSNTTTSNYGLYCKKPETETFGNKVSVNNDIQAITLFEGYTKDTTEICKTDHTLKSPACDDNTSRINMMRCGGHIAHYLNQEYINTAKQMPTHFMWRDTHKNTCHKLHQHILNNHKEHAQHGGAHGMVVLIDTKFNTLVPVNLGLRLMVIRDNKLLYVTADQTILQRYANILFANNKKQLDILIKKRFLQIDAQTKLNYSVAEIGNDTLENFYYAVSHKKITTCIGDSIAGQHGADAVPSWDIYENKESNFELCDYIKLQDNDLIIMATNNFFEYLQDKQHVINEFGHFTQDLTENNPVISLVTAKLAQEPTIDSKKLASYLARQAKEISKKNESVTVQVIRYKPTLPQKPAITPVKNDDDISAQITQIKSDDTVEINGQPKNNSTSSKNVSMTVPAASSGNYFRPATHQDNDADDKKIIAPEVAIPAAEEFVGSIDYGTATLNNTRSSDPKKPNGYTNQDCFTKNIIEINNKIGFIGVFDGHGVENQEAVAHLAPAKEDIKSGGVIAAHILEIYPEILKKQQAKMNCTFENIELHYTLTTRIQDFLREGPKKVNPEKKYHLKDISQNSGTTACMALIDKENHRLTSINIGDSRLIVIRNKKCVFSTIDHTIENEFKDEFKRDANLKTNIKSSKNKLYVDKKGQSRPDLRKYSLITTQGNKYTFIYQFNPKIPNDQKGAIRLGFLTMTRSLGDTESHTMGVTHLPDVETFALEDGDLIVLATDGLWGKKSNELVADFIVRRLVRNPEDDLSDIADDLAQDTRLSGETDDITISITRYKKIKKEAQQPNISSNQESSSANAENKQPATTTEQPEAIPADTTTAIAQDNSQVNDDESNDDQATGTSTTTDSDASNSSNSTNQGNQATIKPKVVQVNKSENNGAPLSNARMTVYPANSSNYFRPITHQDSDTEEDDEEEIIAPEVATTTDSDASNSSDSKNQGKQTTIKSEVIPVNTTKNNGTSSKNARMTIDAADSSNYFRPITHQDSDTEEEDDDKEEIIVPKVATSTDSDASNSNDSTNQGNAITIEPVIIKSTASQDNDDIVASAQSNSSSDSSKDNNDDDNQAIVATGTSTSHSSITRTTQEEPEKPWLRIAADQVNKVAAQVAQFTKEHPKTAAVICAVGAIGGGIAYLVNKNKKK